MGRFKSQIWARIQDDDVSGFDVHVRFWTQFYIIKAARLVLDSTRVFDDEDEDKNEEEGIRPIPLGHGSGLKVARRG